VTACAYAARATWPTKVLCQDVAAAIGMGTSISEVLRAREIRRNSYHRWLSIGRGQMFEWWDGCVIDDDARAKCWELAMAVTHAHLDKVQIELEHLRLIEPDLRNTDL
jgi:hypothetical protein